MWAELLEHEALSYFGPDERDSDLVWRRFLSFLICGAQSFAFMGKGCKRCKDSLNEHGDHWDSLLLRA